MNDSSAIMQRWDAFLKKITQRYEDILAEAEEGFGALAEENPDDSRPLLNAVNAIQMRLIGLEGKIDDTMSEKISESLSGAALDEAENMMEDLRLALREKWEALRVKTIADFYRAMGQRVQSQLQADRDCTQCGGNFTIPELKVPTSVKCEYCGAVNQVTPNALVGHYFSMAPTAFGEEAAAEKRFAIERLESGANRGNRSPTRAELEKLEAMEQDCWESYVNEMEKISPLSAEDRARFIESRMQVWRHAHR
jgi:hypothetical protein